MPVSDLFHHVQLEKHPKYITKTVGQTVMLGAKTEDVSIYGDVQS